MISSFIGGAVIAGILTLAAIPFWMICFACAAWGIWCGWAEMP